MYRGTKAAIVEVFEIPRNKKRPVYGWRKVGPNGDIVAVSGKPFEARRYAAVAGHREYPKLKVLHRYQHERRESERAA